MLMYVLMMPGTGVDLTDLAKIFFSCDPMSVFSYEIPIQK
jgi:hypothetical protein